MRKDVHSASEYASNLCFRAKIKRSANIGVLTVENIRMGSSQSFYTSRDTTLCRKVKLNLRMALRSQITKRVDPGLRLVKRMLRVSSGKSKFKVHMDTIKNLFTHGNGFA
jgi:hypothetical protein